MILNNNILQITDDPKFRNGKEHFTPFSEDEVNFKIKQEREGLTKLIKVYFDFMYYIFMSPVRFAKDVGSNHYYTKVWIPQKICTGLWNILSVFHYISLIRWNFLHFVALREKQPKHYFNFFRYIANAAYKVIVLKHFWFNGDKYMDVLNFIIDEQSLPVRQSFVVSKAYFGFVLCSGWFLIAISGIIIGEGFVPNVASWSPSLWLRHLARLARSVFGFETPETSTIEPPELHKLTACDWAMTFLMFLGHYRRMMIGIYADVGILIFVLTLYRTSSGLAFRIDESLNTAETGLKSFSPDATWPVIYSNFKSIQNFSDKINNLLGNQVTGYFAEGLMYYSANLSMALLSKEDYYQKFLFSVMFLLNFVILKTSADIGCHMSKIKLWLRKCRSRKGIPFEEEHFVLHEISANEIGLRASGMFVVTYHFLGGFLSLIVTCFIISIQ